jgi:hypothetical protein
MSVLAQPRLLRRQIFELVLRCDQQLRDEGSESVVDGAVPAKLEGPFGALLACAFGSEAAM